MNISDDHFDTLITRAMNELPEEYIKNLDNVAIIQADEPTDDQKRKMNIDGNSLLLGLYEGIPLTQRTSSYTFVLPDKITLFKLPLLAASENEEQFYEHIKRTLWHEIAHFYGLSHDDMDSRINRSI